MRSTAPALVALMALTSCVPSPPEPEERWWKGNLHTHSLWSDGDDYPEMILDWYKEQGYHFAALSDHNTLNAGDRWIDLAEAGGQPVLAGYRERFGDEWVEERERRGVAQVRLKTLEEYRGLLEQPGRFLLVQSEEITDRFEEKPVHLNATNLVELIEPRGGTSVADVMQRNVDAVLEQRTRTGQLMFPHVNHPNFGWAVKVEDLIALRGERFFEVYNGHPAVANEGDEHRPSTERMWDILLAERLSDGQEIMYGLAVDDSHEYHEVGSGRVNPGRGWVMVRATSLDAESLVQAMETGEFYSSSGVEIEEIDLSDEGIGLEIRSRPGVEYHTAFIGTRRGYDRDRVEISFEDGDGTTVLHRYSDEIGEVLAEVPGVEPRYDFIGNELYVRARVQSSRLKANPYREGEFETAWVQPVVPGR